MMERLNNYLSKLTSVFHEYGKGSVSWWLNTTNVNIMINISIGIRRTSSHETSHEIWWVPSSLHWQNKQNSVSNMAWMRKSYYYFLCIFWLYQKRSDENIRSSSKNSLFKKHYWLSSGWQHNNRFLNCKFYLLADFYQPNFWQFLVLIDLLCYRF